MANVLLRDLSEDLLADYRAAAKANGRSLSAELKDSLNRGRPRRRLSRDELLELSQRLTEGQPITSDSTPYIRWLRDTNGGRDSGNGRLRDDHS